MPAFNPPVKDVQHLVVPSCRFTISPSKPIVMLTMLGYLLNFVNIELALVQGTTWRVHLKARCTIASGRWVQSSQYAQKTTSVSEL